jgi:hypothetical protein
VERLRAKSWRICNSSLFINQIIYYGSVDNTENREVFLVTIAMHGMTPFLKGVENRFVWCLDHLAQGDDAFRGGIVEFNTISHIQFVFLSIAFFRSP